MCTLNKLGSKTQRFFTLKETKKHCKEKSSGSKESEEYGLTVFPSTQKAFNFAEWKGPIVRLLFVLIMEIRHIVIGTCITYIQFQCKVFSFFYGNGLLNQQSNINNTRTSLPSLVITHGNFLKGSNSCSTRRTPKIQHNWMMN